MKSTCDLSYSFFLFSNDYKPYFLIGSKKREKLKELNFQLKEGTPKNIISSASTFQGYFILTKDSKIYYRKSRDAEIIEIEINEKFKIKNIYSGHSRLIVITTCGKALIYGKIESEYSFGDGTTNSVPKLKELKIEEFVVDVIVSRYSAYYITNSGNVYATGTNYLKNYNDCIVPTKIEELKDIVKGCAGERTIFVVDKNGNLFSWGSTKGNQFVGRSGARDQIGKVEIEGQFVAICGGHRHFIAGTKEGKVYGWGFNAKNAAGQLEQIYNIDFPTEIKLPENCKVKQIHCSRYSSCILFENGNIYFFGDSTFITNNEMTKIDVGEPIHSVATTLVNRIWKPEIHFLFFSFQQKIVVNFLLMLNRNHFILPKLPRPIKYMILSMAIE